MRVHYATTLRDVVPIYPCLVQSVPSGELVQMPGAEEAASDKLYDFLQLRELTRQRLRVGAVEMHGRLGKTR